MFEKANIEAIILFRKLFISPGIRKKDEITINTVETNSNIGKSLRALRDKKLLRLNKFFDLSSITMKKRYMEDHMKGNLKEAACV